MYNTFDPEAVLRTERANTLKAYLILEDGTVFTGTSIGAEGTCVSEIVFNTSMTGYLEVLTDPSYAGQAVCMTYPLIGNYGICSEDMESDRPWPDGFIVRELSRLPSNFRSEESIQKFLAGHGIPGIAGIDTRALTRRLREHGTMNGMITTREMNREEALAAIRAYKVGPVVDRVTCRASVHIPGKGPRVALMDYGAKKDIAQNLAKRGCDVTIYPAGTPAEEVLAGRPDGIMLSNGPGDPKENGTIIDNVRRFYESGVPVFAICLGHQLMALANGAKTEKMPFGHRGLNQPVKDLTQDRVYITSQNHGYAVVNNTVDPSVGQITHINMNDGTCEGIAYPDIHAFTVQFHPEASAGPNDTRYLFEKFTDLMERGQEGCL